MDRIQNNSRLEVAYSMDCGHCNQIDMSILIPIEARLKAPGMFGPFGNSLRTNEIKLKMHFWLQLKYLHKAGLASELLDIDAVQKALKNSEDVMNLLWVKKFD